MKAEKMCLLLAGLCQDPQIILMSRGRLEPKMLNSPDEFLYRVIVDRIYQFWDAHSALPSRTELRAECAEIAHSLSGIQKKRLSRLIKVSYGYSDFKLPYVHQILQELIYEKTIRSRAGWLETAEDLGDALDEMRSKYLAGTIALTPPVNILDMTNESLYQEEMRRRVNLALFQSATGGLLAGEMITIVGPTGGGKTAYATNLCVAAAESEMKALHISTEQPPKTLTAGFQGCAGRVPRDLLMRPKRDQDRMVRKRLSKRLKKIWRNLKVIDLSSGRCQGNGPDEVEAAIRQLISEGWKPDIVTVDWYNQIVDRYLYTHNKKYDNFRHYARQFLSKFSEMAKRYDLTMCLLNQLTSSKVGNPAQPKSPLDTQEFKGFCDLSDFAIGLSGLDDTLLIGYQWVSKSRFGQASKTLIQLDKNSSRFVAADTSRYRPNPRGGGFIETGSGGLPS